MRNLNITDYQENDIITKEYVDSKLGSTPRSEISSVVFANKKFILGKQALADMINLTNIVKSEYIIKVNDYALANTAIKDCHVTIQVNMHLKIAVSYLEFYLEKYHM